MQLGCELVCVSVYVSGLLFSISLEEDLFYLLSGSPLALALACESACGSACELVSQFLISLEGVAEELWAAFVWVCALVCLSE